MILAAGFGTRLLPHTKKIPKPLFPILDKTLLEIAIDNVKKVDPKKIVVNAHHLSEQIETFVKENDFGVEIVVSCEDKILGTAGGIKRAEKWLKDDDFVVVNSDIVANVSWDSLLLLHKKRNAVSTLALRNQGEREKYGTIAINIDGKIVRFLDTKAGEFLGDEPSYMFTGISVVSPAIFELIAPDEKTSISSEVYKPLVGTGGDLYGAVTDFSWEDAGTCTEYHKVIMTHFEKGGVAPEKTPDGVTIQEPVYIDPSAIIEQGAIIGPRVSIHSDAFVGKGARLKDCIVLPNSRVEENEMFMGEVI